MGKLGWFMSETETATSPPREGEPVGTSEEDVNTFGESLKRHHLSYNTIEVKKTSIHLEIVSRGIT